MSFQFRLTFHHSRFGYLRIPQQSHDFKLANGMVLTLSARDADTIDKASRFDFEASGYPDAETARLAGEKLRVTFRVLNSLLGMGFVIPSTDGTSASVSQEIKDTVQRDTGSTVMDTIVGLAIFPDKNHFEYVFSASFAVYPGDPMFLFQAINKAWQIEFPLNEAGEDALEILGRACAESSLRTKFLLTYLAAERVIEVPDRSENAKAVIKELQSRINDSGLDERDKSSLKSAVGALRKQSFKSALLDLANRLGEEQIAGEPLGDFLQRCWGVRNDIAHRTELSSDVDLQVLSDGLRHFVMKVIWTQNKLPSLSVDIPASAVEDLLGGLQTRIR